MKEIISKLPNLLESSGEYNTIVSVKLEQLPYIYILYLTCFTVSDEGENWSMGQRQLFCLGRVLLKQNKILVLDEATASIDSATDSILQKVIREEFANCTVLTVAHRVPTVIDSDMVMVLSFGNLSFLSLLNCDIRFDMKYKYIYIYIHCQFLYNANRDVIAGKILEYDEPSKLMETTSSAFSKLVSEYWASSCRKGSSHILQDY